MNTCPPDETWCPVLASFGIYRDEHHAFVRLADRTVTLQAPQELLNLVQRWCDGATTIEQLRELAQRHWGCGDTVDVQVQEFMGFVEALADARVLVDAAQVLLHSQVLAANPNDWGRRAAVVHRAERQEVGDEFHLGRVETTRAMRWHALGAQRRSCYAFSHEPLSAEELLGVLAAYAPLVCAAEAVDGFGHRATASGGGLYQLQLSLILLREIGVASGGQLDAGVYRVVYSQDGQIALRSSRVDAAVLGQAYRACLSPEVLDGATAWLVVSGDLQAIAAKYRNRAVSHAQIEAGMVLQNIALISAELGLGQLPLAAFDERRIAALCNLRREQPLVTVVLGKPQPVPAGAKPRREDDCAVRWAQTLAGLPYELAIARDRRDSAESTQQSACKQADYCFGRDTDPLVAYQKARCENVERGLMRLVPDDLHWASWKNLTAPQGNGRQWAGVHPHEVIRFSPVQYEAWGPMAPLQPFDEEALYPWIVMRDVDTDAPCWMLADLLIGRSAAPPHPFAGPRYAYANSSGCAASPSRTHALQNALLELVERDAFMRMWLQRTGARELPTRLLEDATQATTQRLRDEGGRVIFLELQSVHAHVVLCVAQFSAHSFTLCGAGAHWDLATAARKALAEVATGSLARLAGVQTAPLRPEDVRSPVDHLHLFCQPEYFREVDYLFEFGSGSMPSVAERKPRSCAELLSALRAAGMKVYVSWLDVPQMPRDYKARAIHAVRAVVPGLVPMTFGYGLMPWVPGLRLVPNYNVLPHPFP